MQCIVFSKDIFEFKKYGAKSQDICPFHAILARFTPPRRLGVVMSPFRFFGNTAQNVHKPKGFPEGRVGIYVQIHLKTPVIYLFYFITYYSAVQGSFFTFFSENVSRTTKTEARLSHPRQSCLCFIFIFLQKQVPSSHFRKLHRKDQSRAISLRPLHRHIFLQLFPSRRALHLYSGNRTHFPTFL